MFSPFERLQKKTTSVLKPPVLMPACSRNLTYLLSVQTTRFPNLDTKPQSWSLSVTSSYFPLLDPCALVQIRGETEGGKAEETAGKERERGGRKEGMKESRRLSRLLQNDGREEKRMPRGKLCCFFSFCGLIAIAHEPLPR